MTPVAQRCIYWALGLFVVGAFAMIFSPDIVTSVTNRYGINHPMPGYLITFITTTVRLAVFPIGAALIGAAVVVQTLLPFLKPGEELPEAQ